MNIGKPAQWHTFQCKTCNKSVTVRASFKKTKYCSMACFSKGSSTLPDKETLVRLYWWDELSHKQIAELYGVGETAVQSRFKRMGIRSRASHRRPRAHCILCEETVCKVKQWKKGRVRWVRSPRCAIHEHLHQRRNAREWRRKNRHKYTKGLYSYERPHGGNARRKPLGQLSVIRRED